MTVSSKIAIHHVGGRWGNHPFPTPRRFAADFINVLYEADVDAIPAIHAIRRDDEGELIVMPHCLSDTDGEATLHIYLNPGLTSLRPLNPVFLRNEYINLFGIDFDDGGSRLLEKRAIPAHRLDTLLAQPGTACPPPDFLSLDVQGAEYEVLIGAQQSLERNVCGVIAEVIFAEGYVGQKRFQEIFDLLDQLGFVFVRFLSIGEISRLGAPIGFRGAGCQGFADALFLRRPGTFSLPAAQRREQLTKLCFMAIVLGSIELAVECIQLLRDLPRAAMADGPDGRAYTRFVATVAAVYERSEKVFPPQFSRILPASRIADFAAGAPPEEWPQLFDGLLEFDDAYRQALERLQDPRDTEFEAFLRSAEFVEQADRVSFLRRHQSYQAARVIDRARGSS